MPDTAIDNAQSTPNRADDNTGSSPDGTTVYTPDELSRPPLLNASQPLQAPMWEFLDPFREKYLKNYMKHKGEKGAQINWLRRNVIRGFQERFGLLNGDDIKKVDRACRVRFTRHVVMPTTKASPSRSRYIRRIDWKTALARAKVADIRARMTKCLPNGSVSKESNLKLYHRAKGEVIETATLEEIEHYSNVAEETNKKNTSPPTLSDVLSRQDEVLSILHDQVNDLLGWDVGQLGDVLCFMAVAVRGKDGTIKGDTTFISNYDVPSDNPNAIALTSNYGKHVHTLFKLVADNILPRHNDAEKMPTVMRTKQGHVVFPIIDVEDLRLRDLRELLQKFIICAWENSGSAGCPRVKENLPWTELDSAEGRKKHLYIHDHFDSLTTFNPTNMTAPEVTLLANKIGGVINSLVFHTAETSIPVGSLSSNATPFRGSLSPPSPNSPSLPSRENDVHAASNDTSELPGISMPSPSSDSPNPSPASFSDLPINNTNNPIHPDDQSTPHPVTQTPGSNRVAPDPAAGLSPGANVNEMELTEPMQRRVAEQLERPRNFSTVALTGPTTHKAGSKRKKTEASAHPKKKARGIEPPRVEIAPVEAVRKTTRVAKPRILPDAAPEPTRKRHSNTSKPTKRAYKV